MDIDNNPFTKNTYLELLHSVYTNITINNINNIVCINDDYFRVNMFFHKQLSNISFKIKVPHYINHESFISFILGILSIKRLKYLIKISIKLFNGDNINCFDYITKCPSNGIYYMNNDNKFNTLWNNIKKYMIKHFDCVNQDAINAIIKKNRL